MRWFWVLPLFLWGAALILHPSARDIDVPFRGQYIAGTFLFFVVWLGGMTGWGSRLAQWLSPIEESPWIWPVLGTIPCYAFNTLIGHLGAAGYSGRWLTYAFTVAGYILGRWKDLAKAFSRARPRPNWAWIPWGLIALSVVLRMWQSALPQLHSDPQIYHLLGPRLWFEQGWISLTPRIPIALEATSWETLFLSANHFVAEPGGKGLIEGSLFAQWIHIVLGYAGTAAILACILRRWIQDAAWRAVAVALAITPRLIAYTIVLAKNDWGVVAWALLGFLFLLKDLEGEKLALMGAGICWGLAFAGKFTVALTLAPLGVAWWWTSRRQGRRFLPKRVAILAAFFALGAAPILIRNIVLVGNPFFPVFNGVFHSYWISPTTEAAFASIQAGLHQTKDLWLERLGRLWKSERLFFSVPILYLVLIGLRRAREIRAFEWACVSVIPLFFFFVGAPNVTDDGTYELRLLGPGIVLYFALIGTWVARALRRSKPVVNYACFLLACAAAFHDLKIPIRPAATIWTGLDSEVFAIRRFLIGGMPKAWLRLHAKLDDLILTTGDNQLYYMVPFKISSVIQQPEYDELTSDLRDIGEISMFLSESGARYLLDTTHFEVPYWSSFSRDVRRAIDNGLISPWAIVYQGEQGYVIDVERLREERLPLCWEFRFRPEIWGLQS